MAQAQCVRACAQTQGAAAGSNGSVMLLHRGDDAATAIDGPLSLARRPEAAHKA